LPGYQIQASVKTETGVEMEALTAVSVAARPLRHGESPVLEKSIQIESIRLVSKVAVNQEIFQ